MRTLYVMYDAHCGLCTEARKWLRNQPAYIPLRLLPSDSEEVRRKFPGLPAGELAVVSESGEMWLGDRAFIMLGVARLPALGAAPRQSGHAPAGAPGVCGSVPKPKKPVRTAEAQERSRNEGPSA